MEKKNQKNKKKIGFIGQGWIGKNYSDDFENRGYPLVRYSLEEPYVQNKPKIRDCDIVFIAVPTPTTPKGFDDSILREAINIVGENKIVVIKSTILPGTTEQIQSEHVNKFILHSPEFLTVPSAAFDAANPLRNIIGIPIDNKIYRNKADQVLSILPSAPYSLVCHSREAELIKYGGNNMLYFKVIYINILYDLSQKLGCNWEKIRDAIAADPRIGKSHLHPIHQSGDFGGGVHDVLRANDENEKPDNTQGRGAGGHCFIKDFAAFHELYEQLVGDKHGKKLLDMMRDKNIDLLTKSKKDLDLLQDVYGDYINNFKE
jgi:UDP-glucose 6-dehydrogenase